MDPLIGVSVARTKPGRWTLGSTMVCEQTPNTEPKPAGTIADWQDGDNTFYLRQRTAQDTAEGDSEIDRIYVGGSSQADWRLGETVICQARAWCEGYQLEADTIRFVQANVPEVPVPEILFSWIDRDLNRSFLIMRVRGRTLNEAWPHLSSTQRQILARDVARICVALAANTSSRFETVDGCGVVNSWFEDHAPESHPTWRPRMLGPFSLEEFQAYTARVSTLPFPDFDPRFCLCHPLLGPQYIYVSEHTNLVSAIVHWECTGYYPRFWVASKPAFAHNYILNIVTDEPDLWSRLLVQALEDAGFEQQAGPIKKWQDDKLGLLNVSGGAAGTTQQG